MFWDTLFTDKIPIEQFYFRNLCLFCELVINYILPYKLYSNKRRLRIALTD